MKKQSDQVLAAVPSVDRILRLSDVKPLLDRFGRELVTDAVRQVTSDLRAVLAANKGSEGLT